MRGLQAVLATLTVVVVGVSTQAVAQGQGPPHVIPPRGKIQGKTYARWSAKWWTTAIGIPAPQNPLVQDGPNANCSLGGGHVRFLFGTFTTTEDPNGDVTGTANRSCAIPARTRLFLPTLNGECSTAEGNGNTYRALRECTSTQLDGAHPEDLKLTVDGVALRSYRVASPLFRYTAPAGNILGLDPQRSRAVADGYWAMLTPLSPGTHVVTFGGLVHISATPNSTAFTFTTTVTYTITVRDKG
jgi:hypothetical protein